MIVTQLAYQIYTFFPLSKFLTNGLTKTVDENQPREQTEFRRGTQPWAIYTTS